MARIIADPIMTGHSNMHIVLLTRDVLEHDSDMVVALATLLTTMYGATGLN